MGYLSYNRVGRRWQPTRGFRLSSRRFSIQRLRLRLLFFVKMLGRLKSSCGQAVESLKKVIMNTSGSSRKRNCRSSSSSARGQAILEAHNMGRSDCKFRSYARSNSFYSEAIAECLEFIKRSSHSGDDNSADRR